MVLDSNLNDPIKNFVWKYLDYKYGDSIVIRHFYIESNMYYSLLDNDSNVIYCNSSGTTGVDGYNIIRLLENLLSIDYYTAKTHYVSWSENMKNKLISL